MRHMGRTHGVSLSWLNEEIREKRIDLGYIETEGMAADIFTKFYPCRKREGWTPHMQLIIVLSDEETDRLLEHAETRLSKNK